LNCQIACVSLQHLNAQFVVPLCLTHELKKAKDNKREKDYYLTMSQQSAFPEGVKIIN